ncbi:hypothetical protein NADFUDRAFT_70902 [Nadsonia fulvescens var. elongata DSM 6958]|uniref:C2 domain-containing protein n=1 Tax=Nadsonia fulvescens var. elongata DSM 6958 TaxID=857566 RepID=A0A1E3PJ53_9ASCO|nr:hypothetical protein NADFUDRAFT_70902 [Nadsonia fulvescens var. elongata DSM 6958]
MVKEPVVVNDKSLYAYLLKLTILVYRTQPRSSASYTSTPSFDGSKLPKEIPKLLEANLKKIALKKDTKIIDPLTRRSFLAFYAVLLSPEFMKQVKDNRRAEDLIMIFVSIATKEMAKNGLRSTELIDLVNVQSAVFVRFLIQAIKENGLMSSGSKLIKQLESYESKLKGREVLNPQLNNFSPQSSTTPNEKMYMPTFDLNDMSLAKYLTSVMFLSTAELQKDILSKSSEATEAQALSDIKHLLEDIENDNSPIYTKRDFMFFPEYEAWKQKEIDALNSLMFNLISNKPSLTEVSSQVRCASGFIDPSEGRYYYLPSDPKLFYRLLVKRCLEYDLNQADKLRLSSPDDSTPLLFSSNSKELMNECSLRWRISSASRAVLLIDVASELLVSGALKFENVKDVFNLAHHIGSDFGKKTWESQLFPLPDIELYIKSLRAIHEHSLTLVIENLRLIYDNDPPKLGPILGLLDEFVFEEPEYADILNTFDMTMYYSQMTVVLEEAAEKKYDELIDIIPRDSSLDPLHVIELADSIIGLVKKQQKRYKYPLFDQIYITKVCAAKQLSLFSADSESMFEFLISHIQARGEDPAFEDIIQLFKKLVEIRDLFYQVSKVQFEFNLEDSFVPFVMRYIQESSKLAVSWVDTAISNDSFLPQDEDSRTMYSTSVSDIFTSFNSAITVIEDLHWNNEYQRAKFYTRLLEGISSAICRYCAKLLASFNEELRIDDVKSTQFKSRQEKWIYMAKTAVGGREMVKPYHFLKETCVKLNNIEFAQTHFDKIETNLDSEVLANAILAIEKNHKRPSSFLFTIRIVQAESLKACDLNGLSDPYVTIIDQESRKQIGKTRTIYQDLNPYWDESFEVITGGPSWLTLTVWDEDSVTSHDLCGRAFIRLDPSAFNDFVSQNHWLDLDVQGRVLVNITMESERDDIRFFFGKAMRTLVRTEDDMIRYIVDKFTAFIKYTLSNHTLKSILTPKFNMEGISNWLQTTKLGGQTNPTKVKLTKEEIEESLLPLFDFLNENFATLAEGLTDEMRLKVMTKTWNVLLTTLESLLLPSLIGKRTLQQQLSAKETDIVFTWLSAMKEFFHHDGAGPALEVLQSQKYQELMTIPVYYDLSTQELIQECEKLAASSFKTLREKTYVALPELIKRKNTVMAHRNKTVLKNQNEKIKSALRESPQNENIILRLLRLRGEIDFVARRIKQRERIAQTLATESIVKNAAGGFRTPSRGHR